MLYFSNPYLRILDEITPTCDYIPSKQEYLQWYKKYQTIIKVQPYNDFCMQELLWAFNEFKNLISFLEHEQTIIEANNRYLLLDKENEAEVLQWIVDYKFVYEYAEHFYMAHFEWDNEKIEADKIVVSKELGIKIALSDFKEFIVFEETFNPLLTKYKNKLDTIV
jgi:hypothetical protein